jgi:prepilin-type N-terminal cleavage/methylation domain-containing protein
MKVKQNNQSGFTVIETLIVLLVVAAIALAGVLVYRHDHKTKTVNASTTASTTKPKVTVSTNNKTVATVNPYAGWKSYCSSDGGLCIKYPTNWTYANVSNQGSNPEEYTFTSPDNKIDVIYEPNDQLPLTAGQASTVDVLSSMSPTSTTDFKVIQAIETQKNSVSVGYFLTSNSVAQQFSLTLGTHTSNQDVIGQASFFQNSKGTNPSYNQTIYVAEPPNPYVSSVSTNTEAKSWFSSSDVKVAGQILESASYAQ